MKLLLTLLLVLSFNASIAGDRVDNIFAGSVEDFEFETVDNKDFILAIAHDAEIACKRNGMCTLFSKDSHDRRFTVELSVGQGSPFGENNTGTTVIIPSGSDVVRNSSEPYYGVKVKYTQGYCRQEVKVPRSLYFAANVYLYNLMNENLGVKEGFTSAEQTMIMFLSTIYGGANGCVAGN